MQTTPTMENVTLSLPYADLSVLRTLSKRMGWKVENEFSPQNCSLNTGNRAERRQALKRDLTPEQLYSVISEEIDDIYANG